MYIPSSMEVMVRRAVRIRIAGAVLLLGWMLMPGGFTLAQPPAPAPDLSQLIAQLEQQIKSLQSQIIELQSELAETQAELKFTRGLQRGASGDDVKELQAFLKRFPDIYPEGLVTGYFGSLTETALKRWQERQGLEAAGVVGPKTRAKLNELVTEAAPAPGTSAPPPAPTGKVTVCHIPPGNPLNAQTLEVGSSALPAHLAHGDVVGICAGPPAPAPPPPPGATTTPPVPAPLPSTATSTTTVLRIISPNGGEQWVRGNTYTVTWVNPFAAGFVGDANYRWLVGISRGSMTWQGDLWVPVTQSSYEWRYWSGYAESPPDAADYKAKVWLLRSCTLDPSAPCPEGSQVLRGSPDSDASDGTFSIVTAVLPPPPASATSTAPAPTPAPAPAPAPPPAAPPPASGTPDIRTGTGSVSDTTSRFTLPTGTMSWSYGDGTQGYLYSSSYPVNPPVSFAGVTASGPSPCSSIWNADYQGISNVCLFTSASNYTFTLPSQTNSVRLFEKSSACYHGLLPFKQGNYYGAIDPEDITASGTLTYRYWYDASGGSNFSGLCTAATPPPPSSTATPTPTQTSACASTIINGYSVPGKNSGESVTVTISSAVPNGTRYASTTFTCTNGSFTAGSETANITCNTGYASVGTQCVATIPQVQGFTATVSGTSVALSWQDVAAPYSLSGAPNNMFGSYNIYRGSSADFTPSPIPSNPTNLIIQGSVLSYTDSNLSAGTYYYKIALQDVNGVVGPYSQAVSATIAASSPPPPPPPSATTTSQTTPSNLAAVLESLAEVIANLSRFLENLRR